MNLSFNGQEQEAAVTAAKTTQHGSCLFNKQCVTNINSSHQAFIGPWRRDAVHNEAKVIDITGVLVRLLPSRQAEVAQSR